MPITTLSSKYLLLDNDTLYNMIKISFVFLRNIRTLEQGQRNCLTIFNERIVEKASDLRAMYNLKTPDAIHLATALDFNAE